MQTVHLSLERPRRSWLIAVPILLFIALAAWAFASPAGASPDDDFHLPSIWCGLGEREGLCQPTGNPETRLVPEALTDASCYAFEADKSARCWDAEATGMDRAKRLNTAPLYPPLFYGTLSVFASPDVQTSVIVMRLFNAALYVGMLTAVFVALPRRIRPALVVSALGTLVPLGLFIIPSTNPSSWALLSATTVWICLYGATQTTGRRQFVLSSLAVVGGVIGAGARADAGIFAVFGLVLAAILGVRRGKRLLMPAIASGIILIAGVGFYLGAKQGGALVNGLPTANPPLTTDEHLSNLLNIPSLWTGALGGWYLGWLDTPMPSMVSILASAVFFAAFGIGIHRLTRRHALAVVLTVAAMWGVPFVLLAQSRAIVGAEVQPRYILPLMVIALGVASLTTKATRSWSGSRVIFAGAALSAAALVALHTNVNRYTKGLDDISIDPGVRAEWWWSLAPSPGAIVIIGGIAFVAMFFALGVSLRRPRPTTTEAPETGAAPLVSEASGGVSPAPTVAPDARS
ncbi:hypothetical protein GCM10009651_09500 [Microbacterium natoriense]|uniref:DUF2142 domain-containing protein n=1 Tax=Microbacterium TaxID=33882 RepID=UPI000CFC54F7|nr:DUF2142 domain-containing protein [Microbacterium sp. MYb72]PRB12306.1 hypothetical protein CQ047_01370 [Microbacterium sp. MYb72]